ncbi:hypothetical protein XELAEV_18009124mg [Xenopus laevis]|uniref:Uncharacterized protein n=1 Tax=Xenopus laevis TaxID=8355 RepID=A0A974DS33_XENLA|nr:hypothetical protein XELAEV_18009124mg [Xenopus laevis]
MLCTSFCLQMYICVRKRSVNFNRYRTTPISGMVVSNFVRKQSRSRFMVNLLLQLMTLTSVVQEFHCVFHNKFVCI